MPIFSVDSLTNCLLNSLKPSSQGHGWFWTIVPSTKLRRSVIRLVRRVIRSLFFLHIPRLNPIENVFSKSKLLAKNLLAEPQNNLNLVIVIQPSVGNVTSADCNNYYVDMSMKFPLAAAGQPLY